MDHVFVTDLRLPAKIGLYGWERHIEQTVRIDLIMAWDNRQPAKTDSIKDTLDYKAVSKRVAEVIAAAHYDLVERLAEEIASTLMAEFGMPWIQVRVAKPMAVKNSAEVGVQIERGDKPA